MMRTVLLLLCALGLSIVASAAPAPTYDEIKAKLRDDHPRLFLTPETRSQIRERAAGSARTYFEALKKKVDAYPEAPQFGIDPAKGEAIKTEGVSGKLPKPLEGVTHILYRQSESGQLEPFAFLSAGSGVDLDRYNDQSISVAGTIYKVPNWNRPLVRVDSVSAARK